MTGATDGIGKEFAIQLAKKGFNILLVSRNEQKLKSTAEEIGASHVTAFFTTATADIPSTGASTKAETRTLAVDFAKASNTDYNALAQICADLDVGILGGPSLDLFCSIP